MAAYTACGGALTPPSGKSLSLAPEGLDAKQDDPRVPGNNRIAFCISTAAVLL
jgi:hypothetical protein